MLELYLTALLYLAAASALTVIIVKKPEMFWECVIFIALLSLSVKICGYAVLDELLAGTMLLGALTVISRDRIKPAPFASTAAKWFCWLFVSFCIYMTLQSLRGAAVNHDIRILRFAFYYAVIGSLGYISARGYFPMPKGNRLLMVLLLGALANFALYLLNGWIAEHFVGENRFLSQDEYWAGSAYAVFPLTALLPPALLLGKTRKFWLSLAAFICVLTVAAYYDSRTSWLLLLSFIVLSFFYWNWKKSLLLLAIYAFSICHVNNYRYGDIGSMFLKSSLVLVSPRTSDYDRNLSTRLGWQALSGGMTGTASQIKTSSTTTGQTQPQPAVTNPCPTQCFFSRTFHMLFDFGVYSHHAQAVQSLKVLYNKYLPGTQVGNVVRPVGFAVQAIDTGWCGVALLWSLFICLLYYVAQRKFDFITVTYLWMLAIVFLWPFISNIQDIVFYYLLLMPGGPLCAFSVLPPEDIRQA